MSGKIMYRRQLLHAIDAFLEGTPSAQLRAHNIIQCCYAANNSEVKQATLNEIVWGFFIRALTDSVFYENETFLRETREMLLGYASHHIARTVFCDDYRVHFTADEAQWYTQLLSMGDFLLSIPFKQIHEATYQARQNKESWESMLVNIPEVAQAAKLDEEYRQRKELIEKIAARHPSPENIGDETIYHLVLREVTSLLTEIRVGKPVVYLGYPIFGGSYTSYGSPTFPVSETINIIENVSSSKRQLEAIAGKHQLSLSWRLSKASTFDTDILIITLY